jgi:hypothetical protein
MNNLTALESEGIIEEHNPYMRTFVDRPFTSYENHSYRLQGENTINHANSQSMNLKETNISKAIA